MMHRTVGRWLFFVIPILLLVSGCLLLLSSFDDRSENTIQPPFSQQQEVEENDDPPRRRLQQRRTLDPASKAAVLYANEMAIANAKERGPPFRQEEKADPFQVTRDMAMKKDADQKQSENNNKKHSRLDVASVRKEVTDWKPWDPLLRNPQQILDAVSEQLDLAKPQVDYLGVTVDAGRYYFPIDWLKSLIIHLQQLNYNLIHLRLTDDEQIVVQLESHPELTKFLKKKTTRYSPSELKELVAFAKDHGISVIPEINLPLRAASWAGIPGLIVPCPNFICENAHYIPLNLEHPQISTILYNVLEEILTIFDHPPMLHLGGTMSLRDSDGCFEEADIKGGTGKYWETFEGILGEVLKKLSYPEEQVIRLEYLRDESMPVDRVGGIEHYWMSLPGANPNKPSSLFAESIVSTELDLAADNDVNALALFSQTMDIMRLSENKPKAIVVRTVYLSPDSWLTRNVVARLIAVSMGASITANEAKSPSNLLTEFDSKYSTNCQRLLGNDNTLCKLKGHTAGTKLTDLLAVSMSSWKQDLCSHLTVGTTTKVFQPHVPNQHYASEMGNQVFWTNFHRPPTTYTPKFNKEGAKKRKVSKEVEALHHKVEKTGVIFDLANSIVPAENVKTLLTMFVAPLGVDMLQLRLSDDFNFGVQLESNSRLSRAVWNKERTEALRTKPKLTDFHQVVDAASEWNMEVFPEVSLSTNAGGWVEGGFLVRCPIKYCKEGTWIPNDIRDPMLLPLVYAVLWELRQSFGGSSPFFHLGADERVENLKCYEEAGLKEDEDPPFGAFESKLKKLLLMLGVKPEHVIRYDNIEQLSYEDRLGDITHYHVPDTPGELPDVRPEEPHFMTADLLSRNIYSIYKDAHKMAAAKPLGVMGEIRTLDKTIWEEQHMGIRLIAFVLGLSTWDNGAAGQQMLTKEEFVKKAIEICRAAKLPVYAYDLDCQEAKKLLEDEKVIDGDDDAMDDLPTLYPEMTTKYRDLLCAVNTRARRTTVMRTKYVLNNGGEEQSESKPK